ncbi:MAG: tyrosine-type recombinase/integrase [Bacilli bacterium]|nr:tyrosine-type recombinase/integrase [Bacilli bacterium]MBQ8292315.1 tyrosine-type recombinase/integrase [Bacilli bacterium]
MNKETRPVTEEEYIEIVQTIRAGFLNHRPNERVAMALILEANVGVRISDIVQLSLNDIVKEGHYYKLNIVEEKTEKARHFVVPNELVQYIKQFCIDHNIKSNERIIPITERAIQKHLDFVCDYLGLEDISTHSFRKFFAENLYRDNDEDIRLVQEALQHSSIETTQRYLKISSKQLEKALLNNLKIV